MDSILDWIRREGVIFRGGSGSGVNLSQAALLQGAALQGRLRLRPGQLHARRRRLRRHDQVGRQDAARGQDGRPRHRPPRRRGVHLVQGARGGEGARPRGGRLRHDARLARLGLDPVPEREQLDPRDRRLHGGRRGERRLEPDRAHGRQRRHDAPRARPAHARRPRRRGSAPIPGVQYDTTINAWHTLPNTSRINASNPCSEYMSIDDSACNLASINLMKFRREDGDLDVEAFEHTVDTVFLAQEILVGYSSYPTPEIERNAKAYRQLGLGYANLGALLMSRGLPYDSDEGRAFAAAITALMTGRAYRKSAEIAGRMGPFAGYQPNAGAMIGVIAKHRAAVGNIEHARRRARRPALGGPRSPGTTRSTSARSRGYRNAQATVLAPTGTISFMMDCDTTGVEPDFSLVKMKKLVGGGDLTIVNKTVPMALDRLGYAPEERDQVVAFIDDRDTRRRRAVPEDRALPGLRLRHRRARHPPHGPREDDGRRPAVHLGRHLEDGEPPRGDDRRRGLRAPARRVEARRQGDRDLPRQLQGRPAALEEEGDGRDRARARRRTGAASPTTAPRSAASSASATTRATSTSASTTTGRPATSSWTSPRRARPSPAS